MLLFSYIVPSLCNVLSVRLNSAPADQYLIPAMAQSVPSLIYLKDLVSDGSAPPCPRCPRRSSLLDITICSDILVHKNPHIF